MLGMRVVSRFGMPVLGSSSSAWSDGRVENDVPSSDVWLGRMFSGTSLGVRDCRSCSASYSTFVLFSRL